MASTQTIFTLVCLPPETTYWGRREGSFTKKVDLMVLVLGVLGWLGLMTEKEEKGGWASLNSLKGLKKREKGLMVGGGVSQRFCLPVTVEAVAAAGRRCGLVPCAVLKSLPALQVKFSYRRSGKQDHFESDQYGRAALAKHSKCLWAFRTPQAKASAPPPDKQHSI